MVIDQNLLNTYERDSILYGKTLKLEYVKNRIKENFEKEICSAFMEAFAQYDHLDQDSSFSFTIPKTNDRKFVKAIQEDIFNDMRASGWIIEEIDNSGWGITGYDERIIIKFTKENLFLDYHSEIHI